MLKAPAEAGAISRWKSGPSIHRLVPMIIRTFALPDARKSAMTFPPVNRKSEIVLLKLLPKSAQQAEMREASLIENTRSDK